jgi:hypothetical protein
VRQFGLYHHSYRFADSDRMSTSIPEQRRKARQILQRFIQIRELLLSGERPSLARVRGDPLLALFDREFEREKRRRLLRAIGFGDEEAIRFSRRPPRSLLRLAELHHRLERRRSSRGPHPVPDGLSWNAVYCMRDVLRELPRRLLDRLDRRDLRLAPRKFYAIALSDYASRADADATPYRDRLARDYQRAYLELLRLATRRRQGSLREVLEDLAPRAEARNPYARMTGDGLSHAARRLARSRRQLEPEEIYRIITRFADSQELEPRPARGGRRGLDRDACRDDERPAVRRIHRDLLKLARDYRESL